MKIKKGTFISFEGPEASGKSSQILLLKNQNLMTFLMQTGLLLGTLLHSE